MNTAQWWMNDENDLYWESLGQDAKWIDAVESLTIRFGGGMAYALLVVRMPNIEIIEKFQSGDGLVVVHNPCGPRGQGYKPEEIRLTLHRCAVLNKGLDSLFTNDPNEVNIVGGWLKVRGIMELHTVTRKTVSNAHEVESVTG